MKLSHLLLATSLASSASAQTVHFSDGFESGMSSWIVYHELFWCSNGHSGGPCGGTWWSVADTEPCSVFAAPFPGGTHAARFGVVSSCSYDTNDGGWAEGSMSTTTPIALPADAGSIALRFWTKSATFDKPGYDLRRVYVNGTLVREFDNSDWMPVTVDITPWAGQNVSVKFRFNAQDSGSNSGPGWYVDDVVVESSPHTGLGFCAGDGTTGNCPCGNYGAPGRGCASSFEPAGARLQASGSTLVAGGTAQLEAAGVSNTVITFFQGTQQQANGLGSTFGDGLRCASGSVIRLRSVQASANAAAVPGPGDPSLAALGALPATGGTRTYQAWYRNAAAFCTNSTFNLSNGLMLTWRP